jgi:hypothetical protein|nr:MAG TPA: hypothetical protein [Caudoviricetes sp.]
MLEQIKKLADRLGNILINFAWLRKEPEPKPRKTVIHSIREKGFTKNNSKVFYIIYTDSPDQCPMNALIAAQSRSTDMQRNVELNGVLFLSDYMLQRVEILKTKIGTELDLKGKTLLDYLINGED